MIFFVAFPLLLGCWTVAERLLDGCWAVAEVPLHRFGVAMITKVELILFVQ
jgi:hypothetical protein